MNELKLFREVISLEAQALEKTSGRIQEKSLVQLVELYKGLSQTGGNLVVTGVGKSGLIAQKIASTFSSLGLPSYFLHPTEALHGDMGRLTRSDVIILISKSGTTEEIIQLLPFLTIPKERIIALVGKADSKIALKAGIVFDCSVDKEACLNDLAPTTSTTVALAVGDAMAVLYESTMGISKEKFALNHPGGLLGKSLLLTVEKLMVQLSNCPIVTKNQNLQDVILAMTAKPVGMCAVVENEKVVGILVEGDIRRAFAKNENAIREKVESLMNIKFVSLAPSMLAFEALNLMETESKSVTVAPVLENGSFKGVLRLHDLFQAGFSSKQK
jgi:arabinose-5-phosphate isomerase